MMNGILSIIQIKPEMGNEFLADFFSEVDAGDDVSDKEKVKKTLKKIQVLAAQIIRSDPCGENFELKQSMEKIVADCKTWEDGDRLSLRSPFFAKDKWLNFFQQLDLCTFKLEMNSEQSYQTVNSKIDNISDIWFTVDRTLFSENIHERTSRNAKEVTVRTLTTSQSYLTIFSVRRRSVKSLFANHADLFGAIIPEEETPEIVYHEEGTFDFVPRQPMVTTTLTERPSDSLLNGFLPQHDLSCFDASDSREPDNDANRHDSDTRMLSSCTVL